MQFRTRETVNALQWGSRKTQWVKELIGIGTIRQVKETKEWYADTDDGTVELEKGVWVIQNENNDRVTVMDDKDFKQIYEEIK